MESQAINEPKKDKIIKLFKDFLEYGENPDILLQSFTRLYIRYTKLLLDSKGAEPGVYIGVETDIQLYHLSELIEILSGGYD